MSEIQNIATTTIVVTDDEFANGYQTGYLRYRTDAPTKTRTDMDIYTLYVGTMTSVRHSGRYHAGYVMGWTAALLGKTPPTFALASHVPMEEVQV